MPAGVYQLSAELPGFKRYVRQGITVLVAQTLRLDIALDVGSNNESVTVTEAAPLLKTESSEVAHNVSSELLNSLPVLGIGRGATGPTGIRSPYSVMNIVPGAVWIPDSYARLADSLGQDRSFAERQAEAGRILVANTNRYSE